MLNHIWLALLLTGILVAAGRDIYDASRNTYRNGTVWRFATEETVSGTMGEKKTAVLSMLPVTMKRLGIDETANAGLSCQVAIVFTGSQEGRGTIQLDDGAPGILQTIAEAQGTPGSINGAFRFTGAGYAGFTAEPVSYVYLKRITNAAFDAAKLAVTIAIGLIGIMALWLGIMKVAEEAGLVHVLAKIVRPVTRRLFPDIPHDHPAIASMMMNIAANMLGLGNAATPFGLKAMEELNSINPRAGVASNSMVTFLALNTSCVTLVPATAIAIRAASGSGDPAAIIGTTFLASLTATVSAVALAKIFQRLRMFRIPDGENA